jgi:hypothetical protein
VGAFRVVRLGAKAIGANFSFLVVLSRSPLGYVCTFYDAICLANSARPGAHRLCLRVCVRATTLSQLLLVKCSS